MGKLEQSGVCGDEFNAADRSVCQQQVTVFTHLFISHTKINKKKTTKISYCSIPSILLTHFLGKIVTKILLTKLTKISGVFSNMKKRHLFLNYFYITRVQEITKTKNKKERKEVTTFWSFFNYICNYLSFIFILTEKEKVIQKQLIS